jgi:hypothetical protein
MSKSQNVIYVYSKKNECDSRDEVENLGGTWDVGTWLRCASRRFSACINACFNGSLTSHHFSAIFGYVENEQRKAA